MRPLFCSKCGNKLTDDKALFCSKCGSKIEDIKPEENKVEEPVVNTVAEPEVKKVAEPEVKKVAEPEVKNVTEPEVKRVTEPEVKKVAEPEVKKVPEPEVDDVAEPEVEEVTEPAVKSVSEPVVDNVAEPVVDNVAEPEVDDVAEPEVDEVTEPDELKDEDRGLPVIVIALIVFLALVILTLIGGLVLYLNKSFLPSINPWYQAETEEAVEPSYDDDGEEEPDGDLIDETDNGDKDNDGSDNGDKDNDGTGDNNGPDEQNDGNANNGKDTVIAAEPEPTKDVKQEETIDPDAPGNDTDGGKIHRYEVVIGEFTWEEAMEDVKNRGDNAYLVHINTKEEYDYICSEVVPKYQGYILWTGARRDTNRYVYKWVNRSNQQVGDNIIDLEFWLDGEPTFYDKTTSNNEYYVDFFYVKSAGRFILNDVPNNILDVLPNYSGKIGYIVEFDE
ncbi:MAG: zinc-ribbon domain-containing protein [Lachnospiraceae bacterium]|nr:zinc-ribbon domain-containing protein [Lachnospiraceae bacterium]